MIIRTGKLCNIGGRKKNDDTVEIISGKDAVRAYVGDGLGSYAGGKQASQTAGDALLTYRGNLLSEEGMHGACQQAQAAVNNLQKETNGTMKTTIVFLNIEENQARWMHVGDSRLYHFVNGKLVKQTTDHSVSQMAVMMGEITTHQIRFHEDRNRVLRSLGGENAKAEVSPVVDLSGANHAFLLCSDGFWEYVYEQEMEQTLRQSADPQEWIERMEQILLQRVSGNNDNYTAGAVFAYAQDPAAAVHSEAAPKARSKGKIGLIAIPLLLAAVAAAAIGGLVALKTQPDEVESMPTDTTVAVTETQETEPAVETTQTIPADTAPETTAAATEPNVNSDGLEDLPDQSGSNDVSPNEGEADQNDGNTQLQPEPELQNNGMGEGDASVTDPTEPEVTDPTEDVTIPTTEETTDGNVEGE